jgi:ribosomal protein L11 methyltransferase
VDWQRLRLRVPAARADQLSDALLGTGALSVDLADASADTPDERPLFGEPGMAPPAAWDDNVLTALFPADADVAGCLEAASEAAAVAPADVEVDRVPEQDWVRLTQAQFAPIRISARLWVVPTWCTPEDPTAVNVRLDPGLAFGTGSHPTTRLCLRWLDRRLAAGASVIDYGCGSGVLAIAARLLGAGEVTGVDIDAQAVAASRANASLNGVDIDFCPPEAFRPVPADVVVANILANPLCVLAPLIAGCARPGGAVVLSGILAAQREAVEAAYRPWLALEPALEEDGWVCVWGIRR